MTYEEPETARFYSLLLHYKDSGCCRQCRAYYAIVSVEREMGRQASVEAPVCLDELRRCGERARAAWVTRPGAMKPPAPEQHRRVA